MLNRKNIYVSLLIGSFCFTGCTYENGVKINSTQTETSSLENIVVTEDEEEKQSSEEETQLSKEEKERIEIEELVKKSSDKYWDAISALRIGRLKEGIALMEAMEESKISFLGRDKYDEAMRLAKKYADSLWNGEWQNPGWEDTKKVTRIGIEIERGVTYEDVKKVVYPILLVWSVPLEYGKDEIKNTQPNDEVVFPEDTTDTVYNFIEPGAGYNSDLTLVSENVMKFPYYSGGSLLWGRIGSGEKGEYNRYEPSASTYTIVWKEEPKVGMTSEDVENSTWGKPKKINRTTYYWGTKEQ